MTTCKYCNVKNSGIFDYSCFGCRERALLSEPCKVLRKQMADNMWRNGEVPDWKVEPNCGCKNSCKRRQLAKKQIKDKQNAYY